MEDIALSSVQIIFPDSLHEVETCSPFAEHHIGKCGQREQVFLGKVQLTVNDHTIDHLEIPPGSYSV